MSLSQEILPKMTNSSIIQTVNLGMCIIYLQLSNTVVAEVTVVQSYDWRPFFREEERMKERMRQRGRREGHKRKKGTRGGKNRRRKYNEQDEMEGWKTEWKREWEEEVSGHNYVKVLHLSSFKAL